jgi:hypothetical protein
MRHQTVAAIAALSMAAALAACGDSAASRLAAPDAPASFSKNPYTGPGAGQEKVTICHAAGRAGTTHYVEITVGAPAQYAHIDEHGTPQAGHEEDYYTTKGAGCGAQPTITKTLSRVFIMSGDEMVDDPAWTPGQPVIIPRGETRWLRYTVSYILPSGVTGAITENHDAVCATAGIGMTCGFNTGGVFSWPAQGTGFVLVDIDLSNDTACDTRTFTNTAVFEEAGGGSASATAPTPLRLTCP